jgi:hypothetical protein
MAKWRDAEDRVPAELAGFAVSDWEGDPDPPTAWGEACLGWLRDHEPRELGWLGAAGGDPVTVRMVVVRLRLLADQRRLPHLDGPGLEALSAVRFSELLAYASGAGDNVRELWPAPGQRATPNDQAR